MCRLHAEKQRWSIAESYHDRPGTQALLADALRGRCEVVLAEALDRISHGQEDERSPLSGTSAKLCHYADRTSKSAQSTHVFRRPVAGGLEARSEAGVSAATMRGKPGELMGNAVKRGMRREGRGTPGKRPIIAPGVRANGRLR